MWWFIIGGVLLLSGSLLIFGIAPDYRRQKEAIMSSPNHTIASLLDIHATLRERGPSSLASLLVRCSISGVVDGTEQTDAPAHEGQAVLYKTRTQEKDASGEVVRTSKREDWTSRFWVCDHTGRILVDPLSATIELFRPQTFEDGQETRTEEALRVGQPVYIMGWLCDFHGQPMIADEGASGQGIVNIHYLITWRTQQSMVKEAKYTWQSLLWTGLILILVGILLIGFGFIA
jgi:hypothetical protein